MSEKHFINKENKSLVKRGTGLRGTDAVAYGLIGLSTFFTVGVLVWIIGFIFVKGAPELNWHFLTADFDTVSSYVDVKVSEGTENKLGIIIDFKDIDQFGGNDERVAYIKHIESTSNVDSAVDRKGNLLPLKTGDILYKIAGQTVTDMSVAEINDLINNSDEQTIMIRMSREGGGIFPMLITTLIMIGLSLLIAGPIGILAAIYLVEYAKPGRLVRVIRFATESLSGIPSIIYGLFGMLFFVTMLKMNYSILAGAMTLSIILLPVIIRQTEESLKAVPMSYREGSLGLGATKLQTIFKVVLPSAVPGIVVAVILSIGRIVGESAALLLTAGTAARIPTSLLSSGATLTIKAYTVAKEEADIVTSCAIGTVIILIILILNAASKLMTRKYSKNMN